MQSSSKQARELARFFASGKTPFGGYSILSHPKMAELISNEIEQKREEARKSARWLEEKLYIGYPGADGFVDRLPSDKIRILARYTAWTHEEQREGLVELAKEAACKLCGISGKNLAKLFGDRIRLEDVPIPPLPPKFQVESLSLAEQEKISRRLLHNLIVRGWSLNHFYRAHEPVDFELGKIGAVLPTFYHMHSRLAQLLNYGKNFELAKNGKKFELAKKKVPLQEEPVSSGVEFVNGRPRAFASAMSFHSLVREISRCVLEAAFARAIPKNSHFSDAELNQFVSRTSDPAAEIFYHTAGPPVAALLEKSLGKRGFLKHLAGILLMPPAELEMHLEHLLNSAGDERELKEYGKLIKQHAADKLEDFLQKGGN